MLSIEVALISESGALKLRNFHLRWTLALQPQINALHLLDFAHCYLRSLIISLSAIAMVLVESVIPAVWFQVPGEEEAIFS